MPNRTVRTRKRSLGLLYALIGLLAAAALALGCYIAFGDRLRPADVEAAPTPSEDDFVDLKDLPETEVVLRADTYREEYLPTSTPEPEDTPEPTFTPAPTLEALDPYTARRPAAANENMLPVFKKANTTDKVIAITLDECSGAAITEQFVALAQKYNAKLTLFPTGENILKNGMQPVLQRCAFQLGYEIENRGFTSLAKLFRYPENMLVQEIWKQSMALNYVLGVRYQPHFLRLYGGLGENDIRTHTYLKQQGYIGVAHWTVSCSDVSLSRIPGKLTPGGIYLFKSTKEDGERMKALMDAARSEGYSMVTLNELFGYEPNAFERVDGSLLAETMPEFHFDDTLYTDLYPGDTAWGVLKLQERLGQLGYLVNSSADGIFGEATTEALRLFQATVGKAASGVGDVATLQALFAEDAPKNPNPIPVNQPISGTGQQRLLEEELKPSE